MKFLKKPKIIVPLLIVVLGGGYYYKTKIAKGTAPPPKVQGSAYQLPKAFVVNLRDGHFANVTVALVLAPGQLPAGADTSSAASDGLGPLPEEAVVRDLVTNDLSGQRSSTLTSVAGRTLLKREILTDIRSHTDVKVNAVLLPDVAVQ